jgi:hypothetical protein
MKKILNEGNQMAQFYTVPNTVSVITFVTPFYYGSGSETVINYCSGSAKVHD